LHLVCYAANADLQFIKLEKTEEYARNTAFYLFIFLISNSQYDRFFDVVNSLCSKEPCKLDPIEEPLIRAMGMFEIIRAAKPMIHKVGGKLDHLKPELSKPDRWHDRFALQRITDAATKSIEVLTRRAKEAK
jgi:hypothetical protein